MSSGSSASNLGYGSNTYFHNINGAYVDKNAYNGGAFMTDNTIPGTPPGPLPGLAGTKSNVLSAAGVYNASGGSKTLYKIKNIAKSYKKMKSKSKRSIKSIKNKIKRRLLSRKFARSFARKFRGGKQSSKIARMRTKSRKMTGGHNQYQNNLPLTPTYQVAGINLPASELGLANPPPISLLSNCTNCVDNYNHFTGKGFPSEGH